MQINSIQKVFALMALSLVIGLSQVNVSSAQSNLADKDLATVLFDFQVQKMRDGAFAQKMNAEFATLMGTIPADELNPEELNRVFGAMSLPDNEAEFQAMQAAGFPESFNAFVRMEFVNAAAADKMFNKLKNDDGAGEREIGGKTFMVSPESDQLLAHRVNETTVEMGTELYLTQETRRMFTENLNAAFRKMPDVGLRIVMDLEGESGLVADLQATAKEAGGGDPMGAAMIGIIDNMSDIRISADLDDKNLLTLAMTGKSAAEAEELRGALDGLLGFAKLMGGGAAAELPDPEMSKMVGEIISGLKAEQNGNDVMIQIARPSNFDAAAKSGLMSITGGLEDNAAEPAEGSNTRSDDGSNTRTDVPSTAAGSDARASEEGSGPRAGSETKPQRQILGGGR